MIYVNLLYKDLTLSERNSSAVVSIFLLALKPVESSYT